MTFKSPHLKTRKSPRKRARKQPAHLPPEPTVQHHKPPPDLRDEVFDASVKSMPNMDVSEDVTRDFVHLSEWAINALGIKRGKITFRLHHNQMIEVTYTVSATIAPPKKDKFDGVTARDEYATAQKIMAESKGVLHPDTVCWCLKTFYSLLFRLSHQEFGTVTLDIYDGKLHAIRPTPVIRIDKDSTWERIWKALYLRR